MKGGNGMTAIKIIYGLVVGILLAILVGVGIATFYQSPDSWTSTAQETYIRNVFIIAYACGFVFLVLGLVLKPKFNIMRIGLLVGGSGTMIYAFGRGAEAMSYSVIFGAIAAVLIVLIFLGYKKLITREEPTDSTTKGEDIEDQ